MAGVSVPVLEGRPNTFIPVCSFFFTNADSVTKNAPGKECYDDSKDDDNSNDGNTDTHFAPPSFNSLAAQRMKSSRTTSHAHFCVPSGFFSPGIGGAKNMYRSP